MLRKLLAFKLKLVASAILKKYKPRIVAITGSVGKSSTKEAIFAVLSKHFTTRKNEANFNTEIGVPMTIIGESYVGRSIWRWKQVLFKGVAMLFKTSDYPQVLILEMGADRPGDIEYLTSFIKPEVSVITNIGVSHLEFFKTVEALRNEKAAIVRALPEDGLAVLNGDDEGAMAVNDQTKAKVVTFHMPQGDENAPVAYAKLAAIEVAEKFGITKKQAEKDLEHFKNLPGRLEVKKGVNGTTIIDDSYNSAPASATVALKYLKSHSGKRKIAVLGKMAELGAETERGHRQVGETAVGVDLLIVKNNEAKMMGDAAVAAGMPREQVKEFSDVEEAKRILKEEIKPGDVILIKGSHSEHLEEVVEALSAE